MASTTQSPIAFMRLPAVKARTGLSRASIYAKIAAGGFPAPVNLGARAVAWIDSDISAWMAERVAASRRRIVVRATVAAEVQQ